MQRFTSSVTIARMELDLDTNIQTLIELAKAEDLGDGDLTTGLTSTATDQVMFRLLAKEVCVFAGCELAPAVLRAYDPSIVLEWNCSDGDWVKPASSAIAEIRGPLGSILSAERVLLNFLQRLSGVATLTRQFVDAIEGTSAAIYDTRKTTPGWRALEKYAVRCGGGTNHRMGLFDAILIKDNHLAGVSSDRLAGVVFEMLNGFDRSGVKPAFVEVEADDPEQAAALLKIVGIDVILLDNFSLDALRGAVDMRDKLGLKGKVDLEASGGIQLSTVRAVAETGVERISVGAITHSARAIDLSLERG